MLCEFCNDIESLQGAITANNLKGNLLKHLVLVYEYSTFAVEITQTTSLHHDVVPHKLALKLDNWYFITIYFYNGFTYVIVFYPVQQNSASLSKAVPSADVASRR